MMPTNRSEGNSMYRAVQVDRPPGREPRRGPGCTGAGERALTAPIGGLRDRPPDDAGRLERRIADFEQVRPSRIVRRRLREDELDEPEDHRKVIAERVQGRTIQLRWGRSVHVPRIMGGAMRPRCRAMSDTLSDKR